jgi:AraC family transcriptional activator of pobA
MRSALPLSGTPILGYISANSQSTTRLYPLQRSASLYDLVFYGCDLGRLEEAGTVMTHPRELWENTYLQGHEYPFNIFRIRVPDCRPDQQILRLHWHEHFEVLFVTEGRAVFHIEGEPYEASPGDVLLVPSGGLHVGYSPEAQSLDYYAFVFNGSMLEGLPQDSLHSRFVAPFAEGRLRFPVRIADSSCDNDAVRDCVRGAIDQFESRSRAYPLAVKAHLSLLFALLAGKYLPEHRADPYPAALPGRSERFKPLFRYVEERYRDKITVEEAARLVSLNPHHFCKLFKKLTGRTFIEYVNAYRMNEAERLLLRTDLTVTEIADRVGCGNPNYFTKLFKQVKGVTPSQARSRDAPWPLLLSRSHPHCNR